MLKTKALSLLLVAFVLLSACGQRADKQNKNDESGRTAAPPLGSVDTFSSSRQSANEPLRPIMDSTVLRMSRVELTNHPVKDFALLMRVHHAGARQLIEAGLPHVRNRELNTILRQVDSGLREEVVMLNRFIVDNRFQQQQKESPVSSKLMNSMSTVKQPLPSSGDRERDVALLLISYLQSANDMVQVMRDGETDYEISGFAEQMVPRNDRHIEALRSQIANPH